MPGIPEQRPETAIPNQNPELVPQDPNHEPAAELLARIRAGRDGETAAIPPKRRPTFNPSCLKDERQEKPATSISFIFQKEMPGQIFESRQVGVISEVGAAATFTGADCDDWAGGKSGDGYAVRGNIRNGEAVVAAMAEAFESTRGVLVERMIAALEAGQKAGGDRRGRQSAALLVVRKNWGYGGMNERFRDLRVEEPPEPIAELKRVYEAHRKLFPRPGPVPAKTAD